VRVAGGDKSVDMSAGVLGSTTRPAGGRGYLKQRADESEVLFTLIAERVEG